MSFSVPGLNAVSDVINSSKIACLAEINNDKMKFRELARKCTTTMLEEYYGRGGKP